MRAAPSKQWRAGRVRTQQVRDPGGGEQPGVSSDARSGPGARVRQQACATAAQERFVGGAERVAQACVWWRVEVGGVCRCWVAGAERTQGQEQATLEYDVPSNGTRRRSYGGGFLCEILVHGDIGPNYTTEISGDARVAVSRMRARSLVRCTRGGEPEGKMAKQR
jgi:hypothetical protein